MSYQRLNRRDLLKAGAAVAISSFGAPVPSAFAAATQSFGQVNVVNTAGTVVPTLIELLKERRYLEDLGVQCNWTIVSDGSKVIGDLVSGGGDVCPAAGFGGIFPAIERGAGLKIIACTRRLAQTAVYSARSDIRSVKDLVGHTIGVGAIGSLQYVLMVVLLRKYGVDPKSVTFVNIGNDADIFKAVVAGKADAGPSSADFYDEQAKFGVHSLIGGNLWEELPEYTDQAAYASDYAIATKRDLLVRVVAAYLQLYRYVQSPNSQAAFTHASVIGNGRNGSKEAETQWKFIQKLQPYALDPVLSEDRVNYMQAINIDLGFQKKLLPFEKVADMSIARDALKLAG